MTRNPVRHAAKLAALAIALLGSAACGGSGGGGDAAPPSPTTLTSQSRTISTQWGDLRVTSEVSNPDWSALEAGADEAIRRIAEQDKHVSFDGVQVLVSTECSGGGQACYGAYYPDQKLIVALAGYERVVNHELQHHACHGLGLGNAKGGECCRLQDHPGGYDLSCNAI